MDLSLCSKEGQWEEDNAGKLVHRLAYCRGAVQPALKLEENIFSFSLEILTSLFKWRPNHVSFLLFEIDMMCGRAVVNIQEHRFSFVSMGFI